MKCIVCGRTASWVTIFAYTKPDKYEAWVDLPEVRRQWLRCMNCGHYQSRRNYNPQILDEVYKNGYRAKNFRGQDIESTFNGVICLPNEKRETYHRLVHFITWGADESDTILDIGSGLGVWPYELLKNGFCNVICTEINEDSKQFINHRIGLNCVEEYTGPEVDILSLVHVLEHMEDPVKFLEAQRNNVKLGGKLFVEVPDAMEFGYLSPSHDEFNSCHLHFYSVDSLYKVLKDAGYHITDLHCERYNVRNLSRIMAMARVV